MIFQRQRVLNSTPIKRVIRDFSWVTLWTHLHLKTRSVSRSRLDDKCTNKISVAVSPSAVRSHTRFRCPKFSILRLFIIRFLDSLPLILFICHEVEVDCLTRVVLRDLRNSKSCFHNIFCLYTSEHGTMCTAFRVYPLC